MLIFNAIRTKNVCPAACDLFFRWSRSTERWDTFAWNTRAVLSADSVLSSISSIFAWNSCFIASIWSFFDSSSIRNNSRSFDRCFCSKAWHVTDSGSDNDSVPLDRNFWDKFRPKIFLGVKKCANFLSLGNLQFIGTNLRVSFSIFGPVWKIKISPKFMCFLFVEIISRASDKGHKPHRICGANT